MIIRNERQENYRTVEEMINKTFWNLSLHYGFKNCKRYNVCLEENVYPVALMVKVLE